jgi:hypothetical protein
MLDLNQYTYTRFIDKKKVEMHNRASLPFFCVFEKMDYPFIETRNSSLFSVRSKRSFKNSMASIEFMSAK